MDKIKKRDWSRSKYKKLARISEENHIWLKSKKGKKSLAGFLEELINKSKKYYGDASLCKMSKQ